MASAMPVWGGVATASTSVSRLLQPNLYSATTTYFSLRFPALRFLSPIASALPAAAIQLKLPSIPSLLQGIWDSILRAVPKKKTTHSKKRHRQMAGKALQDVTSLCKCPACGQIKRMHRLCPHCTSMLRGMMKDEKKAATTTTS